MTEKYKPPFNMTDNITNLVLEIGELIGRVSSVSALSQNPKLRRESRIKSIHSSLAIENNSLTLEQATAIIDGKRVLGPLQDIKEVENAYEAYEKLSNLDPYSLDDLLLAHKFMMSGLIKDAGMFRNENVGVFDGDKLIHAGTPADYVPEVMHDLFDWLKTSSMHPLIKSCIFHYEFEFIHPFKDGNGRTGRLWQSLLLQKWKPLFQWLPVETMIFNNQSEYYNSLASSDNDSDATGFVEFMLRMIRNTLKEIVDGQNDVSVNVSVNVSAKSSELKVLELLSNNKYSTVKELSDILNLSSRQISRIISSLKSKGLLERVGSDKNGYWNIKKP